MTYKTVKDIICSMDRIARERGLKWMDSTMLLDRVPRAHAHD